MNMWVMREGGREGGKEGGRTTRTLQTRHFQLPSKLTDVSRGPAGRYRSIIMMAGRGGPFNDLLCFVGPHGWMDELQVTRD